jgi:hypothetical protein
MKSKPDNLLAPHVTDPDLPWSVKLMPTARDASTDSADTVRRMLARWIAQRIVAAPKEGRR